MSCHALALCAPIAACACRHAIAASAKFDGFSVSDAAHKGLILCSKPPVIGYSQLFPVFCSVYRVFLSGDIGAFLPPQAAYTCTGLHEGSVTQALPGAVASPGDEFRWARWHAFHQHEGAFDRLARRGDLQSACGNRLITREALGQEVQNLALTAPTPILRLPARTQLAKAETFRTWAKFCFPRKSRVWGRLPAKASQPMPEGIGGRHGIS